VPDGQPTSGGASNGARVLGTITVVIVDESAVSRRQLRAELQGTSEFEVVGEARTCSEAVALVERLRPATVLMHLGAPVGRGLEAIEQIMATRPTPIVVYSSEPAAGGANPLDALSAGAIEVVAKPDASSDVRQKEYADQLRRLLRAASRIKVITHPRGRLRANGVERPPGPLDGIAKGSSQRADTPSSGVEAAPRRIKLVAIGASTGGPQALAQVLGGLPADFEPAVVVVQHMADGFIPGLVSWLDSLCPLPVVVAEPGRRLPPGVVSVAPSGCNLLIRDGLRAAFEPAAQRQFHVPGIDEAFWSIAALVGDEAVGVLLTGMGRDGAAGLKALRDKGAVTIGQDEATSAVYGMPAVAWQLGAVQHQLPLPEIADAVVRLCQESS
jgi:two-component system, chemotaxis family, protein-glutamate methylesterase/glutaminase